MSADSLPVGDDGEMQSDVSLSEASSYADARADTPTLGRENLSDSEDTLSSLSFDENGILSPTSGGSDPDPEKSPGGRRMMATAPPLIHQQPSIPFQPVPAPRTRISSQMPQPVEAGTEKPGTVNTADVQVCVTGADAEDSSLNLDLDLPSPTNYKAPTVDFPTSPNQLKILLGPSFFPKEEPAPCSEDDVSFASSCRAKLDLNFQNGGVRLTKRDDSSHLSDESENKAIVNNPVLEITESGPPSLLPSEASCDQLEDYIEDFYLPLSHESVMQRQTSFRRKVQKQLETAATESAIKELAKFETMLSTYEEEDERGRTPSPAKKQEVAQTEPQSAKGNLNFQYGQPPASPGVQPDSENYPSLVDIDAICDTHAPNLMRMIQQASDQPSILIGDSDESGYYIPKTTIEKLYSVYESNNFNNLYTLSGELRHILSPVEIEEIVTNRVHFEKVIDPNVMAALSWSLNESSLPPYDLSIISQASPASTGSTAKKLCESKTSSISNGFHSRNTSDASDDEASTTSASNYPKSSRSSSGFDTPDSGAVFPQHNNHFDRGAPQTASFRRRIALAKSVAAEMQGGLKFSEGDDSNSICLTNSASPSPAPSATTFVEPGSTRASSVNPNVWQSLESLEDLDIEDDIDSISSGNDDLFLVRRDSKRFGKQDGERVVQGLFVESKTARGSNNGSLRRVRVPLNLEDTEGDSDLSPRDAKEESAKKVPKKRIPMDEDLLRTGSLTELDDSSQATDADVTQSEVFHSCLSKTITNQGIENERTIQSGSNEDVTLDLDTPDDMEDSILGKLDSLAMSPAVPVETIPEFSAAEEQAEIRQWKSFAVGQSEIQIDLKAIQPYRRVISHGGYFDAEKKVAIILFSGCFLPDRSRKEYSYLMDHLFLYVLSTLEELIVDDYILVYLHGATPKSAQPSFGWLKRCYQLIDRKLRKDLKGLYLVHPSFWLRTVVALTKPFVSSKFSKKVAFVNTLAELCLELPTEHLVIPDPVLQYDFDMKVCALKRQMQ